MKRLIITSRDKYTVHGIALTECPIERTESGKDFEVGLDENDRGSIQYVSLDGRKVFPMRTKPKESKAGVNH